MPLKLGMQLRVLEYYQVCSNNDPELTMTYLRQDQIWSLVWEKGKTIDFSEIIVVYDYAPNFEEAEGAYWFELLHPYVRRSVSGRILKFDIWN